MCNYNLFSLCVTLFLEKHATGLELVALLSRNVQVAIGFSYELHFSSRYVQLKHVSAMSCSFLEKHATGLEEVVLISRNMQVAIVF
jgi:hypothetical protein